MRYIFATAINCIDGRVQKPLIEFVEKRFLVDYVDMITEPGPDRILSERIQKDIIRSIKRRVLISLKKHNSKFIIIAGHYGCAGNPVSENTHKRQIRKAVDVINRWGVKVPVFGIWLNKGWEPQVISR